MSTRKTDWYDLSSDERDSRCDDPCLPEAWELEDEEDDDGLDDFDDC